MSNTSRLFESYDALAYDGFLRKSDYPKVYILVEDEPGTMYYLPGYIIESYVTGEWFVF